MERFANIKIVINPSYINFEELSLMYSQTTLGERPIEKLKKAIKQSMYTAIAYRDEKIIGAARMISDGVYSLIVDLAVQPNFKRQGVGLSLMQELLKNTTGQFVYLNSTYEAEDFYKKLGFKKQKTGYALYPFKSDYLEE